MSRWVADILPVIRNRQAYPTAQSMLFLVMLACASEDTGQRPALPPCWSSGPCWTPKGPIGGWGLGEPCGHAVFSIIGMGEAGGLCSPAQAPSKLCTCSAKIQGNSQSLRSLSTSLTKLPSLHFWVRSWILITPATLAHQTEWGLCGSFRGAQGMAWTLVSRVLLRSSFLKWSQVWARTQTVLWGQRLIFLLGDSLPLPRTPHPHPVLPCWRQVTSGKSDEGQWAGQSPGSQNALHAAQFPEYSTSCLCLLPGWKGEEGREEGREGSCAWTPAPGVYPKPSPQTHSLQAQPPLLIHSQNSCVWSTCCFQAVNKGNMTDEAAFSTERTSP